MIIVVVNSAVYDTRHIMASNSGIAISSAQGILALLDETDPELQELALVSLDEVVDVFWTEIAESVSKMCASPRPAFLDVH